MQMIKNGLATENENFKKLQEKLITLTQYCPAKVAAIVNRAL